MVLQIERSKSRRSLDLLFEPSCAIAVACRAPVPLVGGSQMTTRVQVKHRKLGGDLVDRLLIRSISHRTPVVGVPHLYGDDAGQD